MRRLIPDDLTSLLEIPLVSLPLSFLRPLLRVQLGEPMPLLLQLLLILLQQFGLVFAFDAEFVVVFRKVGFHRSELSVRFCEKGSGGSINKREPDPNPRRDTHPSTA